MKKTLAILLTLALVICMIPTSVYAADATQSLNVSLTLNSTTYDGKPRHLQLRSAVPTLPVTTVTQ